jgi:hypothetical protein
MHTSSTFSFMAKKPREKNFIFIHRLTKTLLPNVIFSGHHLCAMLHSHIARSKDMLLKFSKLLFSFIKKNIQINGQHFMIFSIDFLDSMP